MWARVDEDFSWSAMKRQDPEDIFDRAAFFRPGVELSVGVGARAAFAKTVVRVFVDDAALVEPFEVTTSRLHFFAAVDNDGALSPARQGVGSK